MSISQSLSNADVLTMLDAARKRTLALADLLEPEQWFGPRLTIVNPPLWEIGHLGWFEERWCLRERNRASGHLPPDADALYDSAAVPHATRWDLPLPGVPDTLRMLAGIRAAVEIQLRQHGDDPDLHYFAQLSALHEEMHCEALTYTRQTHGYSGPGGQIAEIEAGNCDGDVEIAGGRFHLGAADDGHFVFDNEKWGHAVEVPPFRMARTPVTNAQFAAFVEAGGYGNRDYWDHGGWTWRTSANARGPLYWRRAGRSWMQRCYDREVPLVPDEPVMHVNWHEASAWCRWAGRRLPTEAEWEFAASTVPGSPGVKRRYPWGDVPPGAGMANLHGAADGLAPVGAFAAGDSAWGLRQMIGNVWEWTSDWFRPYPGFMRDPYAEYSEPWFGNHKVLRGGCHATRACLIRNTWRNFYTPDRRDVFAGFRTCAL
ncbi:MAG: selenoneine synthase SenA [Burkholderiales bacterium]